MAVVSMTDGSKVGSIRDVLFDISQRQTRAFALSGTNGESVLLFTDVRTIGADAVVVEQASKVQGAAGQSSLDGLRSLSELINLKVVNGDGSLLGQIQEVEIEPADGRVTELTVHSGGVLGIGGSTTTVPAESIRGVGAELVTVEMSATSEPAIGE